MIECRKCDITTLSVDAIVNAANTSLLGGGGVDGAIHRAAGPELLAECRKLNGCETGEAKITKGYRLPAEYVIHTVGPIYSDSRSMECAKLLSNCYVNSLNLARLYGLKSIAFSAISTGVYGYPLEDATMIAVNTVVDWINREQYSIDVIFSCFDDSVLWQYKNALATNSVDNSFKCPCCGIYIFEDGPGSYDICPICYWEDDLVQYNDPAYSGGANALSLNASRENYKRFGACEERFLDMVRKPTDEEKNNAEDK